MEQKTIEEESFIESYLFDLFKNGSLIKTPIFSFLSCGEYTNRTLFSLCPREVLAKFCESYQNLFPLEFLSSKRMELKKDQTIAVFGNIRYCLPSEYYGKKRIPSITSVPFKLKLDFVSKITKVVCDKYAVLFLTSMRYFVVFSHFFLFPLQR
jgi:hypothetical protein